MKEQNKKTLPDMVPTEAYQQVRWERDTAIKQLESYGVSLGEVADLKRNVKAHWIIGSTSDPFTCSNCGGHSLLNYEVMYHNSEFCPHCGAEMENGGVPIEKILGGVF